MLVVALGQVDNNDLFVRSGAVLDSVFGCSRVVYVLFEGDSVVGVVGFGHDGFIFPHIKDVK